MTKRLITLLATACAALFLLAGCDKPTPDTPADAPTSTVIETKKFTKKNVTIEYPQIKETSDLPRREEINQILETAATDWCGDISESFLTDTRINYRQEYRVTRQTDDLISVVYTGKNVDTGEPHRTINGVTIDLNEGKELQLSDFVTISTAWAESVKNAADVSAPDQDSAKSAALLKAETPDSIMAGFSERQKNYAFFLTGNGMTVSVYSPECGYILAAMPGTYTTEKPENDTPMQGARELTEQELYEIQTFLQRADNYGFLGVNTYTTPDDVDPLCVLYDYAGLNAVFYDDWSREEQEAIMGTDNTWQDHHYSACRIAKDDVEALFSKKLGIPISRLRPRPAEPPYIVGSDDLLYSDVFNSYYVIHSGGMFLYHAVVTAGQVTADGLYEVTYSDGSPQAIVYTVTLRKTEDDYQFVSNVETGRLPW